MFSLVYRIDARVLVAALAVAMFAAAALGLRIAKRYPMRGEIDTTLEASIFALLGLLLAFTFNMAGARYDNQRKLIAEEANTIGTATLRADMYPDEDRIGFRKDFRDYLESRIADQEAGADIPRILAARERSAAASKLLWARASRIAQDPKFLVQSNQMIPALNQMFDAASRRFAAERARVPDDIVYLIFASCIGAAFLYAYVSECLQKFEWSLAVGFVVVAAAVVYVTLELDRPRRGAVDVRASEQSLVELRALF